MNDHPHKKKSSGFLGLNGNLDAFNDAFQRYWKLGSVVVAVIVWVLSVNTDHAGQIKLQATVDSLTVTMGNGFGVQDDVHVELKRMNKFMRDSLTSDSDLHVLWWQSQKEHAALWETIDKMRRVPFKQHDKVIFYDGYGPVPDKYKTWFDLYVDKGNQ